MTRHQKPPIETRFWWPHSCTGRDGRRYLYFMTFVQNMANRLGVGALRYGPASSTRHYAARADVELEAYMRTGNQEHLINVANYCFLEIQAPSVKGAHMDDTAGSATRSEFWWGGFVGK